MTEKPKLYLFLTLFAAIGCFGSGQVHAQVQHLGSASTIVIKSGETLELGKLYWVAQCRSILKATPEVEVVDGPDQVAVSVKEAMVMPRWQSCSKEVKGGLFYITAKDIGDPSFSRLSIRVKYKTKDGDRQYGYVYNLQLVP